MIYNDYAEVISEKITHFRFKHFSLHIRTSHIAHITYYRISSQTNIHTQLNAHYSINNNS